MSQQSSSFAQFQRTIQQARNLAFFMERGGGGGDELFVFITTGSTVFHLVYDLNLNLLNLLSALQ